MMRMIVLVVVVQAVWPAFVAAQSAHVVQWRGTSVGAALAELADRLNMRMIMDRSLRQADLDRPVRMSARHLTGEQAFRWTARLET